MEARERLIRAYFNAWLQNDPRNLADIFDRDVIYTECFGPQYKGLNHVIKWFVQWNERGRVLVWDIKQFVHQGDSTAVEWHFVNTYDEKTEAFDGVSLVTFHADGKITALKEFGAKSAHYDPFA